MSLLKWKLHRAFGSAILTLLVTGAMSYRAVIVSGESNRWVRHTNEVLEKIDNLLFAMKSTESGVRGFALSGDESFLDSRRANIRLADQDLAAIGALTTDNPRQQRQISIVYPLLAAKIQREETVIRLRRAKGVAAVVDAGRKGPDQRVMGEFQSAVDKMSDEERRLLALRDADTRRRLRQTKIVMIFGIALGVLITCTAGWSALRDNAARERAEGALLESEEHFRDMANNISQLAWMADEKGWIFWYNQRWFDYSGTTLAEMAGWGWKSVHHPDHVQRVVDKISLCFLSGKVWEDTFPLRDRNGNYRWFLSRAVPIRDADGTVLRWFGTSTDITELRDAEKHLAQMEARYRGLLEAAPDAMVVVNQNGEIVLLNVQAEKRFGYSREELIGQKVTNIVPEGFAERIMTDTLRSTDEVLSQQIGTGIELTGRRRDRSEFPIEIMLSPLDSSEGVLVTAAIRDISERRIAEDALHQRTADLQIEVTERRRAEEQMRLAKDAAEVASQAKSEFLANMSHEIRTPLNGVIGMTGLVLETELTEEQRDYLETAKLSADALLNVINDILDYSKVEAGKIELEEIVFSLTDCVEEALKTMALQANEKGLELLCDIGADVPQTVRGDPGRLRQVLLNLVGNALKFTGEGELGIQITADAIEEKVSILHFIVFDSGVGIAPEKFEMIFDSFNQVDASTTRQFGGTGLGLTISRYLVHLMGGRVWVESELGAGSRFHFTVRLITETSNTAVTESLSAVILQGVKVLIVDDNSANRLILHKMVERWGMNPTAVSDGEHALEELSAAEHANEAYGLMLTDMHMPRLDGFGLVGHLTGSGKFSTPTIMMLTSGGQRGDAARCEELGIAAYLSKPVRQAELREAIIRVLLAKREGLPAPLVTRLSLRNKSDFLRSMHVLLAEDNSVNQKIATRLLEKRGHHVVLAVNGEEALAALAQRSFDLVLMDVHMPGMDGIKATIAIREKEKSTGLHQPVIAMTALAMTGDRERCLAAGMDGYLSKPIDLQKLDEVLAVYADRPSNLT
jgi:PAS domain S-box-containing protein